MRAGWWLQLSKDSRYLQKKIIGDDKVDLEILGFVEGEVPESSIQHMVKEGDQWKFAGSQALAGIGIRTAKFKLMRLPPDNKPIDIHHSFA
jgi:hypothetical protein